METHWQSVPGPRLLFVSAVPHETVADYPNCVDIFVLPSYRTKFWNGQFGLTLVQAMMAVVACIGSCSGAIPEALSGAGVVVREHNVERLYQALQRLNKEIKRRTYVVGVFHDQDSVIRLVG